MNRAAKALWLSAVSVVLGVVLYRVYSPSESALSRRADSPAAVTVVLPEPSQAETPKQAPSHAVTQAAAVDAPVSLNLAVEAALAAGTIDAIEALDANASPTARLDRGELLRQAKLICHALPSLSKKGKGSFVDFVKATIPPRELSPIQIRSGELVDAFRARFCTHGVDFEERNTDVLAELAADLEATGMQAIIDALNINQGGADETETLAVRDALINLLATTDSPSGFFLAAERFSEDSPVAYTFPAAGFDARGADLVHPLTYRPAGTALAYCQLAPSACTAGGLLTMNICLPGNCRQNETLFMFYARTQSPEVMEAAQRYAHLLLQLRRRRGG